MTGFLQLHGPCPGTKLESFPPQNHHMHYMEWDGYQQPEYAEGHAAKGRGAQTMHIQVVLEEKVPLQLQPPCGNHFVPVQLPHN